MLHSSVAWHFRSVATSCGLRLRNERKRVRQLPTPQTHRLRRRTLFLESLEDRRVLSTFSVLNTNDAGTGSLRQAIIDANNSAGADVIEFDSALSGTITLTSGEIAITDEAHVDGNQDMEGNAKITISGNSASGIFIVSADSTIKDLKFVGGSVGNATGVIDSSASELTIDNCEFVGSEGLKGTAIYNTGSLIVSNSLFDSQGNRMLKRGFLREFCS